MLVFCLPLTSMVNVHGLASFPVESTAVYVTVWEPTGVLDPDSNPFTNLTSMTSPELSLAEGRIQTGVATCELRAVNARRSRGQEFH